MIRFLRTNREVNEAGQMDHFIDLKYRLHLQQIRFFGMPIPWTLAHLRYLTFVHRFRSLGVLVWIIYPALLIGGVSYWFITGIVVVSMLLFCAFAILLARGASQARRFLVDSLQDYGPAGRG